MVELTLIKVYASQAINPNKQQVLSIEGKNQMPTVLVMEGLLCSLVDELDQTKLGMHSLDVY
jgi:hypothetical protein